MPPEESVLTGRGDSLDVGSPAAGSCSPDSDDDEPPVLTEAREVNQSHSFSIESPPRASRKKHGPYMQVESDEENLLRGNDDDEGEGDDDADKVPDRSLLHLFGINAFAFAYGILIATFGLITLPLEAERLWPDKHALLLAIFLAICGVSQLSGPVAGFFSDNCTHPLGRRRPFMIAASFVGLPSLVMLRVASAAKNLSLYLVFFLLAMLALNVMYTGYSGALTDLVNTDQRGFANGLMGAFSVLGASIGFGCFSFFLTIETGYYFYLAVLSTSLVISFFAYTESPLPQALHRSWTWKDIGECYWVNPKEHRDFFLVFVSRTLYYMGVSAQTFMLFYFRDIIGSTDPQADVSYLALFGQLSGAIVCVPMGMLSNKLGRKALIYLSSAVIVVSYAMFMFSRTRGIALLAGAVYGVGNGTYLSVDYALACDSLPSKDKAARYLGIWGVGAFIGTLLGPLLIGPSLLLFGDKGDVDADGTPMYDIEGYIVILIIGISCIAAGASVVAPIRSSR